jgi:hypothetical protein
MAINIKSEIEIFLKSSVSIEFHKSDNDTNPSAMVVVATNPQQISNGYKLLHDTFSGKTTKIDIFKKSNILDLFIVCDELGITIEIPNLGFNEIQLSDYIDNQLHNKAFVFMIGHYCPDFRVISPFEEFSPLIIGTYSIQ